MRQVPPDNQTPAIYKTGIAKHTEVTSTRHTEGSKDRGEHLCATDKLVVVAVHLQV